MYGSRRAIRRGGPIGEILPLERKGMGGSEKVEKVLGGSGKAPQWGCSKVTGPGKDDLGYAFTMNQNQQIM